jgi:hypothetical protein
MSVRYQVAAQGLVYTVVDDLQVIETVVITSGLIDEASGAPLLVEAVITADVPGLNVTFTDGALFAVYGYVDRVFPKLATTSYTVNLAITAPGYRPASVTVPIPVAATFPIVLSAIKMRPLPVRVQGRAVKDRDRSALAGAVISGTDATVLLMRTILRFDHAQGKTVNSLATAPPVRNLTADVQRGSKSIFLNDTTGLAATQLLQIGVDGTAEIGVIAIVGPAPKQITLQDGLRSGFTNGATVQQVTPGASVTLTRSANAGDGLLLVSGGVAGTAVQIVDGAQTEGCVLNTVSDAAGYYHFNGMTGVVSLNLQCSFTGLTAATTSWFLIYNDPVNVVDFRLKP